MRTPADIMAEATKINGASVHGFATIARLLTLLIELQIALADPPAEATRL